MEKGNQLIINIGDKDPKEYASELKAAIAGVTKKLFEGRPIEFQSEETTPIYYLHDLAERLEGIG